LEEELGCIEVIFTGSPHSKTVCWERRSGDGTGFWGRERGEYMKVEVLGRSIIVGSNREYSK